MSTNTKWIAFLLTAMDLIQVVVIIVVTFVIVDYMDPRGAKWFAFEIRRGS